jgi:hypothetical protein
VAAGSYNIYIEQGATYDQTFTWRVSGSPVNLTGYSARMQFRSASSSPSVVFDVLTDGTFTLGGAAGTIRVQITAAKTALLNAGSYVYDLELVNGAVVTRLLSGAVTVSAEVTR